MTVAAIFFFLKKIIIILNECLTFNKLSSWDAFYESY